MQLGDPALLLVGSFNCCVEGWSESRVKAERVSSTPALWVEGWWFALGQPQRKREVVGLEMHFVDLLMSGCGMCSREEN